MSIDTGGMAFSKKRGILNAGVLYVVLRMGKLWPVSVRTAWNGEGRGGIEGRDDGLM
jgi:hypothetical protein